MVVIVAILAGILGAWAGYRAARGFPVLSDDLLAAGVVELVMLVQVVVVIVLVVQHGASDPVLLWGYLGAGFVLLPFAGCLLYTSDAADDLLCVDLGGRRIIK